MKLTIEIPDDIAPRVVAAYCANYQIEPTQDAMTKHLYAVLEDLTARQEAKQAGDAARESALSKARGEIKLGGVKSDDEPIAADGTGVKMAVGAVGPNAN